MSSMEPGHRQPFLVETILDNPTALSLTGNGERTLSTPKPTPQAPHPSNAGVCLFIELI